jgi:hypothetical protein
MLQGPRFSKSTTGSIQSGRFAGKMIVIEALLDWDALPWQADWYRSKVKEALGAGLNDSFRLWYIDQAAHGGPPPGPTNTHLVSYVGALHQALLDVSAWVEDGVAPPLSTEYQIIDGQVEVPATARERRGIQPVVVVTAEGGARAQVEVGTLVEFVGTIEVPDGAGKIVAAEWDFDGTGAYALAAQLDRPNSSGTRATARTEHAFTKAGTYFPALRAMSQREGNIDSQYTRVQNLGRVRVIVR